MHHSEFRIGTEFWCGDRRWRCTDVGTRVIVATRIDGVDVTTLRGGQLSHAFLKGAEAEREGWFKGPPYAVAELVFDEYDLEACSLTRDAEDHGANL